MGMIADIMLRGKARRGFNEQVLEAALASGKSDIVATQVELLCDGAMGRFPNEHLPIKVAPLLRTLGDRQLRRCPNACLVGAMELCLSAFHDSRDAAGVYLALARESWGDRAEGSGREALALALVESLYYLSSWNEGKAALGRARLGYVLANSEESDLWMGTTYYAQALDCLLQSDDAGYADFLSRARESAHRCGSVGLEVSCAVTEAMYLLERGRLSEAWDVLQSMVRLFGADAGGASFSASIDATKAIICFLQADYGEAEEYFDRAEEAFDSTAEAFAERISALWRIMLAMERGQYAQAEGLLCDLEDRASWPALRECCDAFALQISLRRNPENASARSEALMWCDDFTLPESLMKGQVGSGRCSDALEWLAKYCAYRLLRVELGLADTQDGRRFEIVRRTLEERDIDLFNVPLLVRDGEEAILRGDTTQARGLLERALEKGKSGMLVQPFCQHAFLIAPTLESIAQKDDPVAHFASFVLQSDAFADSARRLRVFPRSADKRRETLIRWGLTSQEAEVAELAGSGLTNGEIAERLFVTVATVKSHLNRAYHKAHVKGRKELAEKLNDEAMLS